MVRSKDSAWDHVAISTTHSSPGTTRWTCNYCKKSYTGSTTRIKTHLLGVRGYGIAVCPNAPSKIHHLVSPPATLTIGELKPPPIFGIGSFSRKIPSPLSSTGSVHHEGETDGYVNASLSMPPCSQPESGPSSCMDGRGGGVLPTTWQQAHKEADIAIRRLFYLCNIPFRVANNPAWREMIAAIAKVGGPYEGPTVEKLQTQALKKDAALLYSGPITRARKRVRTAKTTRPSITRQDMREDAFYSKPLDEEDDDSMEESYTSDSVNDGDDIEEHIFSAGA